MRVRSVGIDLSLQSSHRAEALDESGQQCGHLSFRTTPQGLEALAQLCTQSGDRLTVVMEPTGLAWLPIALFLRASFPQAVLVRAKEQKVVGLRRFLGGSAKSDRLDAITLAKLPLLDPEHLVPLVLPCPQIESLDRLTRRRDRLAASIGSRKTRIAALLLGWFPGLWDCFEDPWNPRARWVYRRKLNPFQLEKLAPGQLQQPMHRAAPGSSEALVAREALALRSWARQCAQVYRPAWQAGLLTQGLLSTWQQEVVLELDLLEQEEAQDQQLREEIQELYQRVHPHRELNTIPGIGPRVGPLLLAAIGDVHRFPSAKALRQWAGVMPRSHQSSHTQRLGLGMTKEGPPRVKRALYQAAHYARIWDPEMGAIYYRQMVELGKTHKQAMGVVMSHLLSRVYTVLKEERPYQLRDLEGNPVTMVAARSLIREQLRVPEEVRRLRRHNNRPMKKENLPPEVPFPSSGRGGKATVHEAAIAPQRDLPASTQKELTKLSPAAQSSPFTP
ncbi:MAG TPA: IS110 family transposase [Dehalococcoidia bacterium]|nr:IS110 family transposase [Dehalococcoidia bacterium]